MPTTLPCWVLAISLYPEFSLLSFCALTTGNFFVYLYNNCFNNPFDTFSLKRRSNFYFNATFAAYFFGLVATILVMHLYRHAQPALLYLVPACLGTPLFLALVRGDIKTMFKYDRLTMFAASPS